MCESGDIDDAVDFLVRMSSDSYERIKYARFFRFYTANNRHKTGKILHNYFFFILILYLCTYSIIREYNFLDLSGLRQCKVSLYETYINRQESRMRKASEMP